jgi:DNA-directed RNA polymerase specialized sigma24 family protein
MTEPIAQVPSVDEAASGAECLKVVRDAIALCRLALSKLEERALDLVLQEFKNIEIADALRITPNHAGVVTHTVRHKLRKCLGASAKANQKLAACLDQMSGYGLFPV